MPVKNEFVSLSEYVDTSLVFRLLRRNKKETNKTFKDNIDLCNHINIPLLGDIPEFRDHVYKYLFGTDVEFTSEDAKYFAIKHFLNTLGLKYDDVKTLFGYHRTFDPIMISLLNKIGSRGKAYAFITLINFLKKQFLVENLWTEEYSSWKRAVMQYRIHPMIKGILTIKDLDINNVFKGHNIYGTNILRNIDDSVNPIYQALGEVRNINNKLNAFIIPVKESVNEVTTVAPKYLVKKELNKHALVRKFQQEAFMSIFKKDNYTLNKFRTELDRALNDVQYHVISEQSASSVDKVSSRNKHYITLSTMFTDVIKILYPEMKDEHFVKMLDIGIIFKEVY